MRSFLLCCWPAFAIACCRHPAAPSIASFTAWPAAIKAGGSSSLSSTFSGGTGSIDHGAGPIASGGSLMVSPSATTTYSLTVTNSAGAQATATATVTIGDPFRLIGGFPNGSQVEIDSLDFDSGAATKLSVLADLALWTGMMFASPDGTRLETFGNPSTTAQDFYSFPLAGGSTTSIAVSNSTYPYPFFACGTDAAGKLVVIYWTGSQEFVDELDPASGLQTRRGTLGTLASWWGAPAIDHTGNILYVFGSDGSAGRFHLYSFDLRSGTSASVDQPDSTQYLIAGATESGKLVVAWRSGSQWAVDWMNPADLSTTHAGALDGLVSWAFGSGRGVLDEQAGIVYATGVDSASTAKIFKLDLTSGASSGNPVARQYQLLRY